MAVIVPLAQQVVIPFDDQQLPDLASPKQLVHPTAHARSRNLATHLTIPWIEIFVSAVLVGVPDWQARRRHGRFGDAEIWRRCYFVLSHLDLRAYGPETGICRTTVYETEDGSEKGGSSYMVGMLAALTIARATGHARALLHFDAIYGSSGTRPDLVGGDRPTTDFFEAKGRYLPVRQKAMDDAVKQLNTHWKQSSTEYAAATATTFDNARLVAHRQHWTAPSTTAGRLREDVEEPVSSGLARAAEPLVLALWNATVSNPTDVVRLDYEGFNLVCVRNQALNMVVGADAALFDATTTALADDDIRLGGPDAADPRELPITEFEAVVRDGALSDGVFVGWGTNATFEPVPDASDQ